MTSIEHSGGTGAQLDELNGFQNPGFGEHKPRITDSDPAAERTAERQIAAWFILSMIGTVWFIVAYFLFPVGETLTQVRLHNTAIGLGAAAALFGIGIGIVLWAKNLITDVEVVEDRHDIAGSEEDQAIALEIIDQAKNESGIARRSLLRNTLIAAVAIAPLPAILVFRDLGPLPGDALFKTLWGPGVRLCKDIGMIPSAEELHPIKASEVTIGSAFHVIPENLVQEDPHAADAFHGLDEKAKAAVLLMRIDPRELNTDPEREDWGVDGIVAYSKICTHVGCPVALYEHQTHHLLCPCHQSTFDVTNHCKVIFGPAKRPLPQLPIEVDDEGYLVAKSDFTEPVGPTFWEINTRETSA
ncbi:MULTISPECIES: ubiquinol-cytochrome c reductase iron-sulfur subunit [Brevibacterium]|jgi:ubiquinol-cytochrome c reductase iron-sulfur subunit|uniref:Cytochrome bc1 complex Rieske iron-sulfur subunit n=1 Tax=Brevibacterium salitolerans TaxID=1403566 RepID=A0ABN2XAU8_9MICO|nr:Rieske 2Fe-2S domain-containing protein [Brevibacterium sp.]